MRPFTDDELAIAGERHILGHLLNAVRMAVQYQTSPCKVPPTARAKRQAAMLQLLAAHEHLKKLGVNVMLLPATRGKAQEIRRKNAEKLANSVLEQIRAANRSGR